MKNLRQGLGLHIQKSYVEGVYSDNSQNRKLGRVGMSYGQKLNLSGFEEELDNEVDFTDNPKLVLKRAKKFLSDRSFKLVKDLLEGDDFKKGDIYEYKGKIYINTYIEINPERDKDIICLGERKEIVPKEENNYYKFIREFYSPSKLEEKWLTTFEKEESWGKAKYYSMLSRLKIEGDIRQSVIEVIGRTIIVYKKLQVFKPAAFLYFNSILKSPLVVFILILFDLSPLNKLSLELFNSPEIVV